MQTISTTIPDQLLGGYRRFRSGRFVVEEERFRQLAEGQSPTTMIIACADSRVAPSTIFSAAPGELFVVRNVAALVPPAEDGGNYHGTSAAIEFAVTCLKVSNIVVMGHGMCGGVSACLAAAEREPVGQFIGKWVELLASAREQVIETLPSSDMTGRQLLLERLGIQRSITNLLTYRFVAEAENAGSLRLYGAWFSIAEGALYWLDRVTGAFEKVQS